MNIKTNAEKERLRKLTTGKPMEKKEQAAPVTVAAEKENKRPERKDVHGFRDVAGMDELKQLVTEGFINVLNNQECAKAFGITPPSLLFYGPAGCGKTFFAEKVAEELGINFMKVVPDDLACTWVHGTQQKIGELFRKAEQTVVDIARQSLDTKMELPSRELLEEEEWLDRTSWHVGVDEEGKPHSLFPKLGVQSNVASMGKAVRKMANDTDPINLILEDMVD